MAVFRFTALTGMECCPKSGTPVQMLEKSAGCGFDFRGRAAPTRYQGGLPLAPDLRPPQDMPQNCYNYLRKLPRVIALALLITALPFQILPANAAGPVIVNTTITNALNRYLTNVIEITIPNNVFVDEFRTNRVRRDVTNLIDLYQTNLVLQYRTNVLTVDRYATNLVTAWHTNVKTLTLTNWENHVLIRTNVLTVDRYATNLVTAWRTNEKTLNLTNWVNRPVTNVVELTRTNFIVLTVTNWEPVTVIVTNFVSRPITSSAETPQPIPAAAPALIPAATGTPAPDAEPLPTASAAGLDRGLELDLTHVGAPTRPGQFPIRLTLLSASGDPLSVSEWRVEKTDGGGLMVGTKTEFSTVLPAGIYRITARVRAADGTTKNVRGTTEVKTDARAMRTPASVAPGR